MDMGLQSLHGKTLVVGQGLAGSLLAMELHQAGEDFDIVEAGLPYSASKVAAGIINPVTGKRLAASWKFSEFKPFAANRYPELERQLGKEFYQETRVLRLIKGADEAARYEKRSGQEEFKPWLGQFYPPGSHRGALTDPHGSFEILGAATLDTEVFLPASREWLQSHGHLLGETFRHNDLTTHKRGIQWKGREYARAIFCEGYRIRENPWFQHCPMELAAGEIQTIQTNAPLPEGILNAGKWVRPTGTQQTYLAGATYSWDNLESQPSMDSLADMQAGLGKLLQEPYQVLERQSGIRPVTKDRKPLLGQHPEFPALAIFNGLGSKGSLMAPLLARNLVQHLFMGEQLFPGTDARRFS